MRIEISPVKTIALLCGGLISLFALSYLLFDDDDFELVAYSLGGVIVLLVGLGALDLLLQRSAPAREASRSAVSNSFWYREAPGASTLFVRWVYRWIAKCPKPMLVLAEVLGGLLLLSLQTWVLVELGVAIGVLGIFLSPVFNGLAIYTFVRYRQARQSELSHVLAAAVAGMIPLATAARAYLEDRPSRGKLNMALMAFACIMLPLYVYVRACLGWDRYDRLVKRFVARLEGGESLSSALRCVPGIATRQVRLMAVIGEATGSLDLCLRVADEEPGVAAWLEVAPRLVYPLVVLFLISGITTFLMVAIIPKYQVIFREFNEQLPPATQKLVDVSHHIEEFRWIIAIIVWSTIILVSAAIANWETRWRFPVLGRLYRWGMQSTILRALGRLLTAGQTVPQAIAFLSQSADFPRVVQRRLVRVQDDVKGGEPLDAALERAELLPASIGPLVRAAQRARTLPWALTELGDHLAGRSFRLVRRISLFVSPFMVLAIGALVAFIALGMFMPLVQLLSRLSE